MNSYTTSSGIINYDGESYDAAGKKPLIDVSKAQSIGSTIEVHRSNEKTRRLSNSSVRDGSGPSVSEGAEQGNFIYQYLLHVSCWYFELLLHK